MASPFRSLSPALDRPKTAFTSPGNGNGLRKSFNVNVHPKAPAKNLCASTPTNSPAEYPQRAPSPFKDSNSRQSEEIKENYGNENIRPHKSASLRSPTPKGMKSFMAPTFSAASKVAEPRKRILMEKNETVGHLASSMQSPAKVLVKSPSVPKPQNSALYDEPMVEDSPHAREEHEEVSVDCMEVDEVQSTPQPKSKACKLLFEAGVGSNPNGEKECNLDLSEESESLAFLAQFPDPGDEPTILPPYDPKTNYLSPRPQFLRYRPEKDLELEVGGLGCGDQGFLESGPESGLTEVAEIKEIQSLGDQMASVGLSTDRREIHEVEEKEIASVDKYEEKPCNTGVAAFQPRLNIFEEERAMYDDEDEEEEKPSGWLKMSLLFVFVLLSASVALLGSGSPALLPPSLQNNALATGEFYASAVNAVKDVEGLWRKDSVKDMNHSLLQYSRTKFNVIVENVKFWLDSSLNKLKVLKNSVMERTMENSFEKTHSSGIEEMGAHLGLETIVERNTKDHSLPSDEGLLEKGSSTEATLKGFDQFVASSVHDERSTQIASAREGEHIPEGNINLETDLHSASENPSSSGMQEKENKVGAREHGNFMSLSSSETLPRLDVPLSSYSDIDDENDRYGREKGFEESEFSSSSYRIDISAASEESLPMVHSEEADNINEYASEAADIDEIPKTTVLPNHDQKFVSVVSEESEISEPFVPLVSQSNSEVEQESEALDMDSQTLENVTVEDESYSASPLNVDSEYLVKEFQFTERTDSMISQVEERALKESPSSAAKDFIVSGLDASTLPKSSVRELLPSATIGLSILVATALAAIYFVSSSRRNSKISSEVEGKSLKVTKEPADIYHSPYSRVQFISSPQNRIEKRVNSRLSPPRVELLAEYFPAEMSSSDRSIISRASAYDNIARTYERRSRRGNSISSAADQEYAVTPDFSTDSPSFGSFTTYENIVRKEGGRDEEHKVVTPVRRSSRIRKQATSPL